MGKLAKAWEYLISGGITYFVLAILGIPAFGFFLLFLPSWWVVHQTIRQKSLKKGFLSLFAVPDMVRSLRGLPKPPTHRKFGLSDGESEQYKKERREYKEKLREWKKKKKKRHKEVIEPRVRGAKGGFWVFLGGWAGLALFNLIIGHLFPGRLVFALALVGGFYGYHWFAEEDAYEALIKISNWVEGEDMEEIEGEVIDMEEEPSRKEGGEIRKSGGFDPQVAASQINAIKEDEGAIESWVNGWMSRFQMDRNIASVKKMTELLAAKTDFFDTRAEWYKSKIRDLNIAEDAGLELKIDRMKKEKEYLDLEKDLDKHRGRSEEEDRVMERYKQHMELDKEQLEFGYAKDAQAMVEFSKRHNQQIEKIREDPELTDKQKEDIINNLESIYREKMKEWGGEF